MAVGITLAILLGAFPAALCLCFDPIICKEAQKLCEKSFHVPVRVGKTTIHVRRAMAVIDDFSIANPPGYEEPVDLHFSRLEGFVELPSLLGHEIGIHDLQLIKPEFGVEYAWVNSIGPR